MHLNGFDLLMLEDRYLIFLKHFSHLHDIATTVPTIFSKRYIFGYKSMSQTFNVFATESGWFYFGKAFHRLFHLEYSSKAFPGVGSSSLYSWIIFLILLFPSFFLIPITDGTKASCGSLSYIYQIWYLTFLSVKTWKTRISQAIIKRCWYRTMYLPTCNSWQIWFHI